MKVYTRIYIVLSLVTALALAGVAIGVGFIPPLVPSEFAIKSLLTMITALVCFVIIVGGVVGVLGGDGNRRWLSAGAGAISLVVAAAAVIGGWYIFWINPIARAEYEAKILGDSSLAKELASGQLDDVYDVYYRETGYLDYRMERWYGARYSSYGYRRGVPIGLYVYHYPGWDWDVSASGSSPIPVPSVTYLNIESYEIRVGPEDGTLKTKRGDGEWTPLSAVNVYLGNDPEPSNALRELLLSGATVSINNGKPLVEYRIPDNDLDARAERERLSHVIDLIADIYPPGAEYD